MTHIRKYRQKDLFQAATLISETFRKFNFEDNTPVAAKDYAAFYNPSLNRAAIKARFDESTLFLVAERGDRIVGMLRAVDNRIVNLFVNQKFRKNGIGKRLIQAYEKECRKRGYQESVLRSQVYAVPFYLACGYKRTTGIRNKNGLLVQPMKKKFNLDAGV
jgi:GNAT superfamily N-acetyltransferase